MIRFQFFPRSRGVNAAMKSVIDAFKAVEHEISSDDNMLESNAVLNKLRPHLENIGFSVEKGKAMDLRIDVPVLFGKNNEIDKAFHADAISRDGSIVVEVEAGRATENNQFLKDIFEACMMFDVEYLVLAVRNKYRNHDDFERCFTFLETLYISNRLQLPLKGILLIGY